MLSRLVQSILKAVENELSFDNIICFTDSQVSLSWIKAEEKELKTFVQNRVIEIRQNVKAENWSYCRTNENPADLVTRIEGNGVENTIWWERADLVTRIEGNGVENTIWWEGADLVTRIEGNGVENTIWWEGADLVTRIEGNGVENTIWWEGADFLKSNKLDVTKYSLPEHLVFDFEKEVRITETMTFTTNELKTIENIIDIHKYSEQRFIKVVPNNRFSQ